ncbi:MAG: acyl-CoA dehydrogenase protein [Frankiales bacterium]|nr:acyl-CoA dehydrogenase protein [Frankiales bacterium]
MGHYKSNLRDIEFNLFEVFGADKHLGTGPFAELDVDTARDLLRECDRLATVDLAASFTDSDRNPPVFDVATGEVTMPASFTKSYQTYVDGGWDVMPLPTQFGGVGPSPSLVWAYSELVLGANPGVYMFSSGPTFAAILHRNGTPAQKRFAELAIERHWGATMVLTEPDAGSDVGAGRATATPQPDGTWHIEGVKRFITSAEWDWPENIFHLVLARPVGVPGVGGAGTKGLSLFVVPKFLVDDEGNLGERNGAYVTNVEKKMGLKVSTTCELTFGEKHPAIGTLVGDVHDGIAQMFQVIEYARMFVGTKAIATLSTGYLNALDYARSRVQGADLTEMTNKAAPRVPIIAHPDVRLMLMRQKAWAEGMRALVLYTASIQDEVEVAAHAGQPDDLMVRLNDLLLPIVKGYGSEKSYELLATSLQIFGGSGFTQDYPVEQYIRDSKIDTLYEGTTSIQGLDFFFRKIVRDQGAAFGKLLGDITEFAKGGSGGELTAERELLARAVDDVQAINGHMVTDLMSAAQQGSRDANPNIYKVGLNTTRLLMAVGDLVVAWLLLRQAEVALAKLPTAGPRDTPFYEGKVASARWFAAAVLPELASKRAVAEATDLSLMELDPAAF